VTDHVFQRNQPMATRAHAARFGDEIVQIFLQPRDQWIATFASGVLDGADRPEPVAHQPGVRQGEWPEVM